MIIKSLKIYSFGCLTNKEFKFEKGLNLIYGENEKGKSTIEAFIKIMLYGFSSKKINGISERKKYMPFNGSSIKGEMIVETNGKHYIIQRTFGSTKKNDTSNVIDALSGEDVKEINYDEPGKSFLGINRATFEKTLYISQLGVSIEKDKEEEIMDRITSMLGCGENEVPIERALKKLEDIKRTLVTARGVGTLDLLKKDRVSLSQERYEGYKIAEKNLKWENQLLLEKKKKNDLKEDINKLEIYKKYLKKANLQKEYKEITNYLIKSEELKEKEKEIDKNLNSSVIDEKFIEDLKEENRIYLSSLDGLEELNYKKKEIEENLKKLNEEFEEYKFLEVFGDNLREKLVSLKYEQKNLEEKAKYFENQQILINKLEKERKEKKDSLGKIFNIENFEDDLGNSLIEYEKKLKELRFVMEKYPDTHSNLDSSKLVGNNRILAGSTIFIFGIGTAFFGYPFYAFPALVIGLAFVFIGAIIIFKGKEEAIEIRLSEKTEGEINKLNSDISNIENNLDKYVKSIEVNDYTELISALKKYKIFKEEDNKLLLKLQEVKKGIEDNKIQESMKKYKKNYRIIDSMKKLSNCKDIDEVLEKVKKYDDLNGRKEVISSDLRKINENIMIIEEDISLMEDNLKKKLSIMGVKVENFLDIEIYIKEYKEKLKKREEIHSALLSIEETYRALLKDRDIDAIKDELKDIIKENNTFTYKSQDEIELEEKKKSKELLECEKTIKDLENSINNRLIGKRSIIEIEEELNEVELNINKEEKKLKAVNMALDTIRNSFNEIRTEIGPEINKKILNNFEFLTEDRYKEVKLGDNYEMIVRNDESLFKGSFLSNGTLDQLYLSLRFAFIELIFKNEEYPLILDDAFIQYDDVRREKALILVKNKIKGQGIIFTCQKIEQKLLEKNKININYVEI